MSPPARIVLAFLAPLPAGVLRALLEAEPRVQVLGEAPDLDALRVLLRREAPDAVVVESPGGVPPGEVLRLLAEFPRLTVVALAPGERSATVAALRLHLQTLDDPGPAALVEALRAAALAHAWFPLAGEDGSTAPPAGGEDLDRSPPGPDLAVHSAMAFPAGTSSPAASAPDAGLVHVLLAPALLSVPMATAATRAFDQAVKRMLKVLGKQVLPAPSPGVPDPSVSVVSVRERGVGVGNYVGHETQAGFVPDEVFGGRVEATLRIELWAGNAAALVPLTLGVQERLRLRRDVLREKGFIKLRLADTSLPEAAGGGTDWRQSLLCEALFEYEYRDARDAESLIARIPVDIDDPPGVMVVTGALTRWDELGAPPLAVRGPRRVAGLGTLLFVPGAAPAGTVTVLRTFDGATGAPDPFTDPQLFADATGGPVPATRHAQLTFATPADLVAASVPAAGPLRMGDWDQDAQPDLYQAHTLALDPALRLDSSADRLEVAYQHPALEQTAVVYLRALSGPS